MSKQTAVDYITQGLEKLRHKFDQDTILTLQYLIIKAKQMEKEQIHDAFNKGGDWSKDYFERRGILSPESEVYYILTYGGDHE
jgi:hypothetical protein